VRIAILVSRLSAQEMESDSDGSDGEGLPRSAASKRIRKPCSVEGCSTLAAVRGLCKKHGGYTRCREEGCEKQAQSGGLCIKDDLTQEGSRFGIQSNCRCALELLSPAS
jgi:hypothetical protein